MVLKVIQIQPHLHSTCRAVFKAKISFGKTRIHCKSLTPLFTDRLLLNKCVKHVSHMETNSDSCVISKNYCNGLHGDAL